MAKMPSMEERKRRVKENLAKIPKKKRRKYFSGTKTGMSADARQIKERNDVEKYYEENL